MLKIGLQKEYALLAGRQVGAAAHHFILVVQRAARQQHRTRWYRPSRPSKHLKYLQAVARKWVAPRIAYYLGCIGAGFRHPRGPRQAFGQRYEH